MKSIRRPQASKGKGTKGDYRLNLHSDFMGDRRTKRNRDKGTQIRRAINDSIAASR